MTTTEEAIRESIAENRIVWMDWSADAEAALSAQCEDFVEANGSTEFWGTRGGAEWRVHIEDRRAAEAA